MIQSKSIRNPIYRDASSRGSAVARLLTGVLKNEGRNEQGKGRKRRRKKLCQQYIYIYIICTRIYTRVYRSVLFTRNSFHDNCSNRCRPTRRVIRSSLVYLHMDGYTLSPTLLRARYLNFCRARTGNITFAAGMEQRGRGGGGEEEVEEGEISWK